MRLLRLGIAFLGMALAFAIVPAARAQETKDTALAPAAPVPTQIATATSVFISNAGADATSTIVLKSTGDPNEVYNRFYAAMKKWGRFQISATSSHPDLVMEIRFYGPLADARKVTTYAFQVELRISDAKTHTLLWTIDEPVEVALRTSTWVRNINEGVTNVVGDLQRLVAQPVAAPPAGSGE